MKFSLAMVVSVTLAGSCHYGVADIATVPDNPTYDQNVYPLLRDHCLLCHSSPPNRGAGGANSYFRLDVYGTTTVNGKDIPGAGDYCGSIVGDVLIDKMPPAAKDGDGVGPNGKKMLQNWQNSQPVPCPEK